MLRKLAHGVLANVLLPLLFDVSNCVDYDHDHELRTASTASTT
jgi:hypothetical protein